MKPIFRLCIFTCMIIDLINPTYAFSNSVEQKFIKAGLVDIASMDKTITVDLVNSDKKKNIFRENYYDGLNNAYLRKCVALKLLSAQASLKEKYPKYSLKILDAARPRSVSKSMYEKMKDTKFERYVANPSTGSMHNYGIAVDITIIDEHGKELDMGISPFNKSNFQIYWQWLKMKMGKKLTPTQQSNRKLLSEVMLTAGFYPLAHEWWHFNGMKKVRARQQYKIIE